VKNKLLKLIPCLTTCQSLSFKAEAKNSHFIDLIWLFLIMAIIATELAPTYDNPKPGTTVQQWLDGARLVDVEVGLWSNLFVRGTPPVVTNLK
jgi:hypothetical protein